MSQEPPFPPGTEWLLRNGASEESLRRRLATLAKEQLILVILQLLAWIALLRGQGQDMKARLSQNSRNSSRPPSSDGYEKPAPKSQRKKTSRKSGGQEGHTGVTLEMVKVADHYEYHSIDSSSECECGESLALAEVLEAVRRQVFDLPPPPPPEVTEHVGERRRCKCGRIHTAPFPAHVTQPTQYGPRVQGLVSYFSQEQLLPYGRTQEVMHDVFGVGLSQGTIKNILERAHRARWDFELRMTALMQSLGLLHFDETGIYVQRKGNKYWLHVACDEAHTLFHADKRRGTWGMRRTGVLPHFKGTAVHDHWKSYFGFDCRHVLCNAHHLRELLYAHEQYKQAWALKLIECLVQANDEVIAAKKAGANALSSKRLAHFSELYDSILRDGKKEVLLLPAPRAAQTKKSGPPKQHKVKNLFDRLSDFKDATLAFLYDFSVPFTNNQGERDIRMTKVKLKVSGCFRSILGAQMFARTRSYISTAKKQKINVIDALIALFDGTAGGIIRRMTKRPKNTST